MSRQSLCVEWLSRISGCDFSTTVKALKTNGRIMKDDDETPGALCWLRNLSVTYIWNARLPTNDYFHYWLICWIYFQSFNAQNVKKNSKKMSMTEFLSPVWCLQVACFISPTVHRYSLYNDKKQIKTANHHNERAKTHECWKRKLGLMDDHWSYRLLVNWLNSSTNHGN